MAFPGAPRIVSPRIHKEPKGHTAGWWYTHPSETYWSVGMMTFRHSQYMESHKKCFKPPTSNPFIHRIGHKNQGPILNEPQGEASPRCPGHHRDGAHDEHPNGRRHGARRRQQPQPGGATQVDIGQLPGVLGEEQAERTSASHRGKAWLLSRPSGVPKKTTWWLIPLSKWVGSPQL